MSLELNFRAQGLAQAMHAARIDGVVDTAPCFASLLVQYDPDRISLADLTRELLALNRTIETSADALLVSRLFYLPVLYLDPWTRRCVEQYSSEVRQRAYDADTLAASHGLRDAAEFARHHASSEWWVAAIGSWPGLPFCMALDPCCRLTAPKYSPPRTTTPRGSIGLGGSSTAIYSVESPGGYQIFGRTPVPIFDPGQRLPAFAAGSVLLRAGDRIRFMPVEESEYHAIDAQVIAGTYLHEHVDYQRFSVTDYRVWAAARAAKDPR